MRYNANTPIIRQIKPADNEDLAKMIREVFIEFDAPKTGTVYSDPTTDNLFELFKKDKSVLWVVEFEGKAMGCCGIYPTEGLEEYQVELVKYYVSSKIRGKGIGRKLIEKCIKSAKNFGYELMYIETVDHFSKAIGIYEKLDFKIIDKPLGNSGHNGCDIWLLKKL